METDLTREELALISQAIVALRRLENGCPNFSRTAIAAVESNRELLEMYEEYPGHLEAVR